MLSFDHTIRVRYGETDKMGFVYYGYYALYYESARTELMRNFGFPYTLLEAKGVLLPVISMAAQYFKPCRYDDLIIVRTTVKQLPLIRLKFDYEVLNQEGETLNSGNTTHGYLDAVTGKVNRAPAFFVDPLRQYFDQ